MFQCAITSGILVLYPTSFFELVPQYLCRELGSTDKTWSECKPEDFCGKEHQIEHKINYDSNVSLENWITTYDLTCAPKYQIGLFGSLYFFAVVAGSLLFAPLADKIGRRPITLAGVALAAIT